MTDPQAAGVYGPPRRPELNRRFPACAWIARRLLAEVYGCQPGDLIPGEDELLAHARTVIAAEKEAERTRRGLFRVVGGKAQYAVAMVQEIGGIFDRADADEKGSGE